MSQRGGIRGCTILRTLAWVAQSRNLIMEQGPGSRILVERYHLRERSMSDIEPLFEIIPEWALLYWISIYITLLHY